MANRQFRLLLHEAIPQKKIGSSRCSSQQELLVSSLAQTDALTKLLIDKGLITEAEITKQLSTDRAVYQAMFKKVK